MIDDIILIEDIKRLFLDRKVIYGPDKKTAELLKEIKADAEFFTSLEEDKIGHYYESKKIIPLDKVLELSEQKNIILIIPEDEEKINEIQEIIRKKFGGGGLIKLLYVPVLGLNWLFGQMQNQN